MSINQRKSDHIRINLEEDVSFPRLTTGLDAYRLDHLALPELDLDLGLGDEEPAPGQIDTVKLDSDELSDDNHLLALRRRYQLFSESLG